VVVGAGIALIAVVVVLVARSFSGLRDENTGRMAPRVHGPVTARGMHLYNSDGTRIRLLGLHVSGMAAGSGLSRQEQLEDACGGWATPDEGAYDQIASWGFNFVRIPISWSNLEPIAPGSGSSHQYNEPYLRALDTMVDGFTRRGLAVVIEMAQSKWSSAFQQIETDRGVRCQGYGMPAWMYPNASQMTIVQAKLAFFANQQDRQWYADAWRTVAERYAGNSQVIGFDMLNEPYIPAQYPRSLVDLDSFYRLVGSAIRSVNPSGLLMFQDTGYDPGASFGVTKPPPFEGVVYSFHLYTKDWTPDGKRIVDTFYARAKSWNVPLWLGEFNAFSYGGTRYAGNDWEPDTEALLAYSRERDISWSFHSYAPGRLRVAGTDETKPGLLPIIQAGF
jgi:cellulase (glycosyl hydrolase family 5)